MDIELPDGTVITDIPEGTTKAQLAARLQAGGMNVPKEWLPKEESMISQVAAPFKRALGAVNEVAGAVAEPLVRMGTGAIAKPVSDIAGLAATGYEALTGGGTAEYAPQFQRDIQDKITESRAETGELGGC